jgi:hypothetical protein
MRTPRSTALTIGLLSTAAAGYAMHRPANATPDPAAPVSFRLDDLGVPYGPPQAVVVDPSAESHESLVNYRARLVQELFRTVVKKQAPVFSGNVEALARIQAELDRRGPEQ